jgi:hypothetical protein
MVTELDLLGIVGDRLAACDVRTLRVLGLFFVIYAIAVPALSFCAKRSEVAESIDRMDPATSRRVTAA